ncbi:hypothetical protein BC941DRAFT_508896 [Chlamydoabsidia padenii]|nr:hypothetical protein BC941DRAFT_508896 [Chlamydoabsidia padenii]
MAQLSHHPPLASLKEPGLFKDMKGAEELPDKIDKKNLEWLNPDWKMSLVWMLINVNSDYTMWGHVLNHLHLFFYDKTGTRVGIHPWRGCTGTNQVSCCSTTWRFCHQSSFGVERYEGWLGYSVGRLLTQYENHHSDDCNGMCGLFITHIGRLSISIKLLSIRLFKTGG